MSKGNLQSLPLMIKLSWLSKQPASAANTDKTLVLKCNPLAPFRVAAAAESEESLNDYESMYRGCGYDDRLIALSREVSGCWTWFRCSLLPCLFSFHRDGAFSLQLYMPLPALFRKEIHRAVAACGVRCSSIFRPNHRRRRLAAC